MNKLVIASNNPGKLREFQHMLAPLGIEVLTQAQLGISEAEEPHCTFIENALAKARHVSRAERFARVGGRFRYLRRCFGRRSRRAIGALCRRRSQIGSAQQRQTVARSCKE